MKKSLLTAMCLGAAFCMSAQTVVFEDDFEWLEPWSSLKPAGQTVETDNPDATAQQLATNKVDNISTYDALIAKGYEFPVCCTEGKEPREAKAQVYLQRNYLKFGLTNYYSGITLPTIDKIPENVKVTLSYDWCSMRRGKSAWDPTQLVVVVKNGDTEEQFIAPTHNYEDGEAYAWLSATVDLGTSVKTGSLITIRNIDAQWPGGNDDKYRWFIDNIKVTYTESEPEPVADLLWSDDFEWFAPWSIKGNDDGSDKWPAGDTVGTNNTPSAVAPQIGMPSDDEGVLFTHALHSKGFRYTQEDMNGIAHISATKNIYIQTNYLKFSKTDYINGIAFPPMKEDVTNIVVEFDWCPMRGAGGLDIHTLRVFAGDLVSEDEQVVSTFDEKATAQVPDLDVDKATAPMQWFHASVSLGDAQVKAGQYIGIRPNPTVWTSGKYYNRWFLDNVKIYGTKVTTSVDEVAVDAEAPVEYYNLQGVRVANPENGLYIVRQGKSVRKVLVK